MVLLFCILLTHLLWTIADMPVTSIPTRFIIAGGGGSILMVAIEVAITYAKKRYQSKIS